MELSKLRRFFYSSVIGRENKKMLKQAASFLCIILLLKHFTFEPLLICHHQFRDKEN